LYVENDWQEHPEALIGMLEALGYEMWWHLTPLFNPQNYAHNANNVFGVTASINLICVPREMPMNIQGFSKVMTPTDWWE
jgi:hypothetical protein